MYVVLFIGQTHRLMSQTLEINLDEIIKQTIRKEVIDRFVQEAAGKAFYRGSSSENWNTYRPTVTDFESSITVNNEKSTPESIVYEVEVGSLVAHCTLVVTSTNTDRRGESTHSDEEFHESMAFDEHTIRRLSYTGGVMVLGAKLLVESLQFVVDEIHVNDVEQA